jgi:hypothetical protein
MVQPVVVPPQSVSPCASDTAVYSHSSTTACDEVQRVTSSPFFCWSLHVGPARGMQRRCAPADEAALALEAALEPALPPLPTGGSGTSHTPLAQSRAELHFAPCVSRHPISITPPAAQSHRKAIRTTRHDEQPFPAGPGSPPQSMSVCIARAAIDVEQASTVHDASPEPRGHVKRQ